VACLSNTFCHTRISNTLTCVFVDTLERMSGQIAGNCQTLERLFEVQ